MKSLDIRTVRDALVAEFKKGADVFNQHTYAKTGTVIERGAPDANLPSRLLLITENQQVFEITIRERKDE